MVKKSRLGWHILFGFISFLLVPWIDHTSGSAQAVNEFCQLSPAAVREKENLRIASFKGDKSAQSRYQNLLKQHAQIIRDCRRRTWPQNQAVWLRLYPCDIASGAIEQIMDRVVNQGYNQVYVETFYDGRVLLPLRSNPTVWPSVIQTAGAERVDLLATAIQRGRERGLKVYSWMYTTNFGFSYAQREDREDAIARNGKGQTSLYVVDNGTQVFIDPYHPQARRDYYLMVQEVLRRRPDGILFDYIRYPRQAGTDSIATRVTDLWLYSPATQQALLQRVQNRKGWELVRRFLAQGYVSASDINQVDQLFPQEGEPMWQGRTQSSSKALTNAQRQPQLQWDLWQLSVAHTMQGIVDFLEMAAYPAQQLGIPAGAVFFPYGNQIVGRGYDSRLQPWDRFPRNLEFHAMAYANCGSHTCITDEVQRVVNTVRPGTKVIPAIAGNWGTSVGDRPPLEVQMRALRRYANRIEGISHFAYSWQFPQHDRDRKFCRI